MYTSARTPELSEILQSLYISDIFSASDEEVLDTTGITHVVSVCQNIPWLGPPPGSSYRVLNINVDDSLDADLLAHFDASNAFIHEALAGKQRGKVLCHCLAGISRSPTVVIAYLIGKMGMSLPQAFDIVRERRPIADPNPAFVRQLEQYEALCRSQQQ
jgi:predicted protein tyrosine phosphatase